MRRILVVEDEVSLAYMLAERLRKEGFEVHTCPNGEQALESLSNEAWQLMILDVMLPGIGGFEVCRELRRLGSTLPVLMLTARSEVEDRVKGLRLGADDYLGKPFEVSELLARIDALLRRSNETHHLASAAKLFSFDRIQVDFRKKEVTCLGTPVELSAREFQLLTYFIQHAGATLSRDELLDKVWGYQSIPNTRTVDVHVAQLRQKLEENPKDARHILTVYGFGYKFVPHPVA